MKSEENTPSEPTPSSSALTNPPMPRHTPYRPSLDRLPQIRETTESDKEADIGPDSAPYKDELTDTATWPPPPSGSGDSAPFHPHPSLSSPTEVREANGESGNDEAHGNAQADGNNPRRPPTSSQSPARISIHVPPTSTGGEHPTSINNDRSHVESTQESSPCRHHAGHRRPVGKRRSSRSKRPAWHPMSFFQRRSARRRATAPVKAAQGPSPLLGAALMHFHRKLRLGFRTALAIALATTTSQFFWNWAHILTWFSVTLVVSGTHESLGRTLRTAFDFWKGFTVVLPLVYLIRPNRDSTPLTITGLFFSVAFLIWLPGISDPGKRMATIFLTIVVIYCVLDPALLYNHMVRDVCFTLLFANAFSIIALLLPFPSPSLALLDVRVKLGTVRHRLGSILRGCNEAFSLGEEVHYSMLEQLLQETSATVADIKEQIPFVKWEAVLLRLPVSMPDQLESFLTTIEAQLELFRGMRLSLRRMSNNATHQVGTPFASWKDLFWGGDLIWFREPGGCLEAG